MNGIPLVFVLLMMIALLIGSTWVNSIAYSSSRNSFPSRRQGGHCQGTIPPRGP